MFDYYGHCLSCLSDPSKIEATLRIFELDLLEAVGYGLQLDYDLQNNKAVDPLTRYHFNAEQGPIAAPDGLFSGKTLLALKAGELTDSNTLYEAKTLMRKVIAVYLHGKPLKSRAVINQIIQHL